MNTICSLNAPHYDGTPGGIRTHDPRFRSQNPFITTTPLILLIIMLCKPSHIDRGISLFVRFSYAPQYAPHILTGGVCHVHS